LSAFGEARFLLPNSQLQLQLDQTLILQQVWAILRLFSEKFRSGRQELVDRLLNPNKENIKVQAAQGNALKTSLSGLPDVLLFTTSN
jgi:hypothetical protein